MSRFSATKHPASQCVGLPPGLWTTSAVIAVLVLSAVDGKAAPAAEIGLEPDAATIHLKNSDFAAGRLLDSPPGGGIAWQSRAFVAPLHFPLEAVRDVQFPLPAILPELAAEFRFDLTGGNALLGSLVAFDDGCFVVDVPKLGQLRVERSIVRRILRAQSADMLFLGPSGLEGWQSAGPAGAWRDDGGQLSTREPGAEIYRSFDLPAQTCFEFELAWNSDVDFELALGVSPERKTKASPFRFEVQEKSLIVLRESALDADVAEVQEIKPGPGRLHLRAFLDQPRGRLLVCSAAGKKLAELTVADDRRCLPGIQLIHKKGDIRLERLRISRWGGELPLVVEGGKDRAESTDGRVVNGSVTAFDTESRQFVLGEPADEQRIDAARVQELVLAGADAGGKSPFTLIHHSGIRLSGELLRVDRNAVWLHCPGIREPVGSQIEDLNKLLANHPGGAAAALQGREGRLELEGARLHGWLEDSHDSEGSCLLWHPSLGDASSRLARAIAARIVYREPPALPVAKPRRTSTPQGLPALIFDRVAAVEPSRPSKRKPGASVLHLRCGDTISAKVTKIDEQGVTFVSEATDATFIPHAELQAVELLSDAPPLKIVKLKKDRLLTLPRMQRDNPPTHLLRSVDGDYLRGRLLAMDEREIQVEVRLDTKTIPRPGIARIIWLHPEAAGASSATAANEPAGTRVQSLTAEPGARSASHLTFVADRLAGTILSGRSELLGKCQVDLKLVDQLLIGPAIDREASVLTFHQWTLRAAAEPRADDESKSGGNDGEGLESALVGKPAPELELDTLDGTKFHVADYRNKVLVLDFWASWCGPCLQAMPLVDKVAREFADQDVRLVGINLQEGPERIQATLERLQVDMQVALDSDGRLAEKYGATAIPQTVIVDRQGKVARLFVGGGPRFDEQLRAALRSVLGPETSKKD